MDLAGACRRDRRPRFPLPETLVRKVQVRSGSHGIGPYRTSIGLASSMLLFREDKMLIKALYDLNVAIEYTTGKSERGEYWAGFKFCIFWIDPIVHSLVGQGFSTDGLGTFQETTRLGLLLLLSKLRRHCGQLGVSTKLFTSKMRNTISDIPSSVSWGMFNVLLLWSLFVGMLESHKTPDHDWYLEKTAKVAYEMGFWGWDDTIAAVKEFIWIGGNDFDDELENFRDSFESMLSNLILSELSIETVS